jgi:hypothetical protein
MMLTVLLAASDASEDGFDWSTPISVISLVVALALAIREFSARPQMTAWANDVFQYSGTEERLELAGTVVHIGNLGRSPLPIDAVGAEHKDYGIGPMPYTFSTLRGTIDNPVFPLSLAPGEFTSVYFSPGERAADGRAYVVDQVTISWWDRARRRGRMSRRRVRVDELRPADPKDVQIGIL